MGSITDMARAFFDVVETGKGWAAAGVYCTPEASFTAQAEPLADIKTLQAYAEWMRWLLTCIPDGRYEVRSFATDAEQESVCAYAVFMALTAPMEALARQPARARGPTTSMSWSLATARSAT